MAFAVTDIEATRAFYAKKFGYRVDRSAERWIDFDFFGHQVSAHLVDDALSPDETNPVDGKKCHHATLAQFWSGMTGIQ